MGTAGVAGAGVRFWALTMVFRSPFRSAAGNTCLGQAERRLRGTNTRDYRASRCCRRRELRLLPVRRERAIEALNGLKTEAVEPRVMSGGEALTAWRAKVRATAVAALGGHDNLVKRLDQVNYSVMVASSGTPQSAYDGARHRGIRNACGLIDAAVYQLELLSGDDEPVDERAFDPDLWEHVKGLVEEEDWGKVASQTVIFVEAQLRAWAGDPKDRNGGSLYGKGLFVELLRDDADWRLGATAAEREGWRALGTGFVQAIGNVDRHHRKQRTDARRYAIGVLGLGSLLLTQMRLEHGELIEPGVRT